MKMFHYKGNDKLDDVIKRNSQGYTFGKLQYCDEKYKVDEKDVWYSYDERTHNFHIVPDESAAAEYQDKCNKLRKSLANKLGVSTRGGSGTKKWAKCHRYLEYKQVEKDEYAYLISFNCLTCSKTNEISNVLGKIQFYRYRTELKNINWTKEEGQEKAVFKMMYPSSAENGEIMYDEHTGHCVYNAPVTIENSAEEITKAFNMFVKAFDDKDFEKTKENLQSIHSELNKQNEMQTN